MVVYVSCLKNSKWKTVGGFTVEGFFRLQGFWGLGFLGFRVFRV